jgi:hypothetical protein
MTPKRAFIQQRANAKRRNIEWRMTFEEWLEIWLASGRMGLRGRGVGKYCMSRFGDRGPYALGNVEIKLHEVNVSEGSTGIKRTDEQNAARTLAMIGNQRGVGVKHSAESLAKKAVSFERTIAARRNRDCGTTSRYHAGCRCSDCRAANAAYMRSYYHSRKHPDGAGEVIAPR